MEHTEGISAHSPLPTGHTRLDLIHFDQAVPIAVIAECLSYCSANE